MVSSRRRILGVLAFAAAAVGGTVAPAIVSLGPAAPVPEVIARPCVDGIVPGNPNIPNCTLPQRGPPVRGQAPDAAAIIACRGIPGCLSYYVNYPGATIWGPPIATR